MRIKGFRGTALGACAVVMLTMPAHAQFAPQIVKATQPDNTPEIVVTGKVTQPPAVVRRQAQAVTQNLGDQYKVPLAQLQDPVCPGVLGMPREIAEVIVSRIRSNAEAIGLEVAREGKCEPNIIVGFVISGQDLIKRLDEKRGYMFKHISVEEVRRMAADPGPVHAWVNTVARSRHGDVLRGDDDAGLFDPPTLYVANSHSHIWMASRLDILNSVVLMDLKAVDGMSAVQLADYATMRTFARTRPAKDAAVTTILGLFDGSDSPKPLELTDFDMAYLRSIYSSRSNLNAASRLAHINSELAGIQKERVAEESAKARPAATP